MKLLRRKLRTLAIGLGTGLVMAAVGTLLAVAPWTHGAAECPVGSTAVFTQDIGIRGGTSYTYTVTVDSSIDADRTITIPKTTANDTVVLTALAQTLTNKTLTSPTIVTSLVLDQTTADYTVTWADPSVARALTIPDPGADDTFVFLAATQTLTNKMLTSPTINGGTVNNITSLTVANNVDIGSYELRAQTFESDVVTGTAPFTVASTTVVTNLNADKLDGQDAPTGTIVGTSDTQTLTNKTLTSPTIQGTVGAGTGLTMPAFNMTGDLAFQQATTISATGQLTINGTTAVVFNEDGADVDFRVEADANTHIIYVDAGLDVLHLGTTATPSNDVAMRLWGNAKTVTNNGSFYWVTIGGASGETITAQGTNNIIASLRVWEPQINLNGQTVANSASLYIGATATEATNNYALWVDTGDTRLDGNLEFGSAATISTSSGHLTLSPAGSIVVSKGLVGGSTAADRSWYGGTTAAGSGGRIRNIGSDNANQLLFYTSNALKDTDTVRLSITGNADTATATWSNVVHSGIKVESGGSISGAGAWTVTADSGDITIDPPASVIISMPDSSAEYVTIQRDNDAGSGPNLALYKNSASPGTGDVLGNLIFQGRDSLANVDNFAKINSSVSNATSGSEDSRISFSTMEAGALASRVYIDAGLVVGAPTDGDKGAGTINAEAVYDDGVVLTDYVFEPDYDLLSIDDMRAYYQRHKHLPTIPGRDEWEANGKFSLGALASRLWETVEVQARYIAELEQRLDRLEAIYQK